VANLTQLETIPTLREEFSQTISYSSIDNLTDFQDYQVIKQFASQGAESDIYVVQKDNQKYILKLYRFGIEPKKDILDRLVVLSQQYVEDLVKIYETGFDEKRERWFEIQEYIENGSLRNFKENIDTEKLYEIIKELSSLLHTLHRNKIIHRDIKPENILIRSYIPLDLVVTDFGISSLLDDSTNIWTSNQGTHKYFAPESFSGVIGTAIDYWSLGMIIYELANGGKHYFDGVMNNHTIQLHITTKEIDLPSHFDTNIKQLLGFLFLKNPENRGDYTLVQKWLKGEDIGKPKLDETPIEDKDGYPFDGKNYHDFSSLAQKISRSYRNWTLWGNHLENGTVLEWAKIHKQYDKQMLIETIDDDNKDGMVLEFIYTFNHEIKEFRLLGKVITLNNLYLYTQNHLNNKASEEEKKIYQLLVSGKIKAFYSKYQQLTQTEERFGWVFNEIATYIKEKGEDGFSKRVVFKFLEFVNYQDAYLLPKNKNSVNIKNFHHFVKKEDIAKISPLFMEVLKDISIDESKKLKQLIHIDREEYYYPLDFFKNLEISFSQTINQIECFIKKSVIEDIEKRYYIPQESPYSNYIQKIKESSSDVYLQAYRDLKVLKKETLLLTTQLEEAKKQEELFNLLGINLHNPSTHQLHKIKKVLDSNIDLETYQKIKSIDKEKVYKDFRIYISRIENLNIPIIDEDKHIVDFIKNYQGRLKGSRALLFLFSSLIIVVTSFYPTYLLSFILALLCVILSYILIVNRIVLMSHSFLNRIGKIAKVTYHTKEELSNKLIVFDNILVRFVIWGSTILLTFWILFEIIQGVESLLEGLQNGYNKKFKMG